MKNFVLIGAAGYVAPRHMEAIKKTGNKLLAALDPNDSVGIIDKYFPEASFFTEFERFDRHIEKLKRDGTKIHFVTVCSPNYLHDAHARFGLRHGAHVICEKPLVLNPWNVEALKDIEIDTDRKIYNILQLRLHPAIKELRKQVGESTDTRKKEITLTYITSRGKWYFASWKGDESKSGGIATNIGIHFFDMLIWLFGSVERFEVHSKAHDHSAGYLSLKNANVKWYLSINRNHLPAEIQSQNKSTFRSIDIDDQALEFSDGFEDLHISSYEEILKGNGYSIEEIEPAQKLVYDIRQKDLTDSPQNIHPLVIKNDDIHPFYK